MVLINGDVRPSLSSGGSEGTTVSVFLHIGHMKQFRAQLRLRGVLSVGFVYERLQEGSPVLLSSYARAGHLEQTVWAVVPADFHHDTPVTSDGVALFAEEEVVQRVEARCGRREARRRRVWRRLEARAVVKPSRPGAGFGF